MNLFDGSHHTYKMEKLCKANAMQKKKTTTTTKKQTIGPLYQEL